MDLTLRTRYWDDPAARAAFRRFLREIHGLDLSEWEAAGCWDDAYTPFSYFRGDAIVASVCIYLLDFVVDGRPMRLAQISGVGTLPGWRRRGLSRRLTGIGLDWARGRHEGVFLFANPEAVPYYRRCGFSPLEERVARVAAVPVPRREGAVGLDPGRVRDRDRIHAHARRRAPVSERFGVLSARLFMFHALHGLRDRILEIPELDCLVACERRDGCLSLFDVVGARIPRLEELYPYLADPDDRLIEFHFPPDRLVPEGTGTRPLTGNHPFVLGDFPVARPIFPFTCRA